METCVSPWKVQRELVTETLLLTESYLEELCSASRDLPKHPELLLTLV